MKDLSAHVPPVVPAGAHTIRPGTLPILAQDDDPDGHSHHKGTDALDATPADSPIALTPGGRFGGQVQADPAATMTAPGSAPGDDVAPEPGEALTLTLGAPDNPGEYAGEPIHKASGMDPGMFVKAGGDGQAGPFRRVRR